MPVEVDRLVAGVDGGDRIAQVAVDDPGVDEERGAPARVEGRLPGGVREHPTIDTERLAVGAETLQRDAPASLLGTPPLSRRSLAREPFLGAVWERMPQTMRVSGLRRLRRRLAVLVLVYFFAGAASQKLVPGVDEIIPFYGWSLFSKVPGEDDRYVLLVHRHKRRILAPPVSFLQAPDTIVTGNRYIGRKVIQRLGKAVERGEAAKVADLRRLLEQTYLSGRVRYELIFERYDPIEKWRTGANREARSLGQFTSGEGG